MIKKILVPLDGSKIAECALSYSEELATKLEVEEVVLLSVTERIKGYRLVDDPSRSAEESLMPEAAGKMTKQANRYLNRISAQIEKKGIHVTTEVRFGTPAEEIIIYANTENIDLIIMSSHGRSGPSRWAFGSVADKVSRGVRIPVMIIRAPGCVIDV